MPMYVCVCICVIVKYMYVCISPLCVYIAGEQRIHDIETRTRDSQNARTHKTPSNRGARYNFFFILISFHIYNI